VGYKLLGFVVWKGARLYLRRRYGGVVTKRRLVIGGLVVALTAGGAAVALRPGSE
jgi:hypothetical protein